MHIALDAMGGDRGAGELVAGALRAACRYGHRVTILGDRTILKDALDRQEFDNAKYFDGKSCPQGMGSALQKISIVHTSQVVGMDESPLDAIRKKKDSSVLVAFNLLSEKKVDAVVSAGNSGATMAAAIKTVGKLKSISRPGIAGIFPTLQKPLVMMDVGANVDCRPKHLYEFAVMATAFSQLQFGIKNPRVGLLSIGEEGGKGNALVKSTHEILVNSTLNFIGNVEGRDIFHGDVDVIVCDGFVGNVCLKLSEGLAEAMVTMLKEEFSNTIKAKVGYLLSKKAYTNFKSKTDYAEYGGAPLLGFNGTGIICHGRSNAKAIENAIKIAADLAENNVNDRILSLMSDPPESIKTAS